MADQKIEGEIKSSTTNGLKLWDIDQIFDYKLDENDNILGDRLVAAGELTLVIGSPGVGKSRLVVQLVMDILLGHSHWLDIIPIHQRG